jgi:hypothetical protein
VDENVGTVGDLDYPELAIFPLSFQRTALIGPVMYRHEGLERDNEEKWRVDVFRGVYKHTVLILAEKI